MRGSHDPKPKIVRIAAENSTFQLIEALRRNREKRQKGREFLVEGVRQINRALYYGWTVNAWLYTTERPLSSWAKGIVDQKAAQVHYQLSTSLLEKLSGKQETSELIALVAMPEEKLERIALRPAMLIVVFDRPSSPGNLGTLIRSCDALGADGLVITGHAADLYDPETISASTGSVFALPTVRVPSGRELEAWLAHIRATIGPFQIVGSSAKAEHDIAAYNWTQPTVLIIGNETSGMSAYYKELCDTIVKIPIGGSATSLNVACATSILLYEIQRQRRA
ncbi:MAG: RNA methyltransferase [Chloroflexota bacterium]|nr:RNA methyltransferase [Chloroflexota bacterium]